MHKARSAQLPYPLQNLFRIGIFRPCLFSVKPTRIIQSEKSVSHSAPKVWNALPSFITQETDFSIFKRETMKHFLANNPV